jgi:hypothetical protein
MSSSNQSPDLSRVISELSRQVANLASSVEGGHSGSRSRPGSTGGGRAAPKSDMGDTSKSIKELNAGLKEVDKTLDKLNRGATDVAHSHKDLYTAQNSLIKGIVSGGKKSEAQQQKLVEAIDKAIKSQSILGNSMSNSAKSLDQLNEITEKTGEFLHVYAELLKKSNTQSLSSIADADKLRDALLKMQKEMDLGAEINEMIRKKEFSAAAKKIDDDAKSAVNVRNEIKKTANQFNVLTNVTGGLKTAFSKAADVVGAGFLKEASTLSGSVGLVIAGAKEAYKQFKDTASSGFGGEFFNLSKTAIGLGISLEALTKITKENMTQIGRMGLDGFNKSLKDSQIQLMQLGLTTEEAAKTRAVMNENAMLTGVDVTNKKALNKSTQEQIGVYETLRATTGESIETIANQTKAIINSNDSMKIMSSMTRQQRVGMLQSINMERARLTAMGLSNEAAMKIVNTVNAMANEKTVSRVEQANKLQAAGAAVGMDSSATDKISSILMKSKGSRTDEDKKLLADYAKEYNKKSGAMQGDGADLGKQIVGDYADEMAGHIKDLGDDMSAANMDRGLNKDQIDANKAMGRIPKVVAEGISKIESGLQLIQSPLLKIAAGIVGIGIYLAMRARAKKTEDIGSSIMDGFKKATGIKSHEKASSLLGGKEQCCPGSSIQGDHKFNQKMTKIAEGHGYMGDADKRLFPHQAKEGSGFSGMNDAANKIKSDRDFAATRASKTNRAKDRVAVGPQLSDAADSIGSSSLQDRIAANRKKVAERSLGNPGNLLPSNTPPPSRLGGIGKKVGGSIRGAAGKVGGALETGMGAIGKLGAKAIPFLGLAVVAIDGIMGAFDGVSRAAEIFGVDVNKDSLTTAQKVSAGIAGALNTITFGLIPTDSTARLFNDIAEDGVSVLTDYWEEGMEFMYNKAVPAIWDGFKSVLGFIGNAIVDVLSPSTWISMFTGDGDSGFVGSILRSVWKGVEFLAVALTKGVVKFGADIVDKITSFLPKWMVPEALTNLGAKNTWASSDTHVSDFDNEKEAGERSKRKDKKAKRDKASSSSGSPDSVPGHASDTHDSNVSDKDQVKGTPPLTDEQKAVQDDHKKFLELKAASEKQELAIRAKEAQGKEVSPSEKAAAAAAKKAYDEKAESVAKKIESSSTPETALGMVSDFNSQMTSEQLAAQGVVGSPSESTSTGVNTPAKQAEQDASKNSADKKNSSDSSSTSTATAPKSETLLSGILEQVTLLVDLTTKKLDLSQDAMKMQSTQSRLPGKSDSGHAPSMQSFINTVMV